MRRKGSRWGRICSISARPSGVSRTATRGVYCPVQPGQGRTRPAGSTLPAASHATTRTRPAGPVHGTRTTPAAGTRTLSACPFTRNVSNARLADPDSQGLSRQNPDRRCVRIGSEGRGERARSDGIGCVHLQRVLTVEQSASALRAVPTDDTGTGGQLAREHGRDPSPVAEHTHPHGRRVQQREAGREPIRPAVSVRRKRLRRDGDVPERPSDEHCARSETVRSASAASILSVYSAVREPSPVNVTVCVPSPLRSGRGRAATSLRSRRRS